MNKWILILTTLTFTGCASMQNGSTQPMKISTRNDNSPDTTCSATNEEGHWDNLKPSETFTVHRDGNPLVVKCENPKQSGTGTDDPEFQTRFLVMDIILVDACIISCLIDGGTNAFYDYSGLTIVPMQDKP